MWGGTVGCLTVTCFVFHELNVDIVPTIDYFEDTFNSAGTHTQLAQAGGGHRLAG